MVPCLALRLNSGLTSFWTIQYVNLPQLIDQRIVQNESLVLYTWLLHEQDCLYELSFYSSPKDDRLAQQNLLSENPCELASTSFYFGIY